MKKTLLIIPLILIIITTTAIAATGDYLYPGYDTRNIDGLWSSGIDIDEITDNFVDTTNSPNSTWTTPLVGDLNGDGTNEIALFDGNNIEIYHDKTLTAITGITDVSTIQHAILFDITGDGNLDIITTGSYFASAFTFNGTTLNLNVTTTLLPSSVARTTSQEMIGCVAVNDCAVFSAEFHAAGSAAKYVMYNFTTTSGVNESVQSSLLSSVDGGDYFLPKIRSVAVADYDGDGIAEYVTTAVKTNIGGVAGLFVAYANTANHSLEKYLNPYTTIVYSDPGVDDFTSPLVFDASPADAGMETIVAYQAQTQAEFEMIALSATGAELKDFPDITFADGTIISNIVRATVFEGSYGDKDFCVLGYDTPNDLMYLLCGSFVGDDPFFDGETFEAPTNYDVSEGDLYPFNVLSAVQTSEDTTDGLNLHEFLTPFGVYSINWVGVIDNTLALEYLITASSYGIAVPSDVEKNKNFDILYRAPEGLYYIDDGFSNSQANIDAYTFTNNPLCVNRTYTLGLSLSDAEGDSVTCWVAVLLDNETGLWNTTNKTAATGMSIYLKPNETGYFFYDMFCTDNIAVTPDYERRGVEVSSDLDVCCEPGECQDEVIPNPDPEPYPVVEFTHDVDTVLCTLGVCNSTTRNIISIIIMLIFGIGIYVYTRSMTLALTSKISIMLILFYMGMLSIFPFIVIIIVSAAAIVWSFTHGGGSPAG